MGGLKIFRGVLSLNFHLQGWWLDFPISRYCCDSENDSRNTIVYDSVAIVNDSLKVVPSRHLISKFFYYNLKIY